MKRIILIATILLTSFAGFAQENSAQAMEMLKQMQNNKSKIMLVIEGKTYNEKAMIIKDPQGKYFISSDLTSAKNIFSFVVAKKETGSYELAKDKKETTVFVLTGNDYEVKSGTVKLINSGGKISGTFTGKAQKFVGKKGNKKPQGDLIPFSGSFSGLPN